MASIEAIDEIQPELLGHEVDDQRLVDQAMIDLDRTLGKSRLVTATFLLCSVRPTRSQVRYKLSRHDDDG